ncbi:MAG: nickel-dependent lactate racemase [bacterium]|nr:MAG: nickel-dependent lactate racemase [bacterium]
MRDLPYGQGSIRLTDLWEGKGLWTAPGPFHPVDGEKVVQRALEKPLGIPSLHDFLSPGCRCTVVVPDLTRRASVRVYLPLVLDRLRSMGVAKGDVTIVVALGIHRSLDEAELATLVGEQILSTYDVVNHDPDDPGGCVRLGITGNGIPVQINSRVAQADRVILTGNVTYHYFAGYGGGGKALLPGVSSRESCESHHKMVVAWRRGELEGDLAPGVLEGNPVQRVIREACALAPPHMVLNVVTDPRGGIIGASAGARDAAHLEACRTHDAYYRRRLKNPSRLVIASAGGFPKDINFIQAHKGLFSAHMAAEAGGVVILAAQCPEGAGHRDFFSWFDRCRTEEQWLQRLEEDYQINGQTAFSTWLRTRRTTTILVSRLDPGDVHRMGMIPSGTMEEALREAERILGGLPVPVILPDAGDTLPVTRTA